MVVVFSDVSVGVLLECGEVRVDIFEGQRESAQVVLSRAVGDAGALLFVKVKASLGGMT